MTIVIKSLSVSSLISTYVTLTSTFVAFLLIAVAHIDYLANKVRANWPEHAVINILIHCGLIRARISSPMEPTAATGLSRSDGKLPDGFTLVSWSAGKIITWNVTVFDTLVSLIIGCLVDFIGYNKATNNSVD